MADLEKPALREPLNIASAFIAGFCISIAVYSKGELDKCRFNYSIEKIHSLEEKANALANGGGTSNGNSPFDDVDKVHPPVVLKPNKSAAQERIVGQ